MGCLETPAPNPLTCPTDRPTKGYGTAKSYGAVGARNGVRTLKAERITH